MHALVIQSTIIIVCKNSLNKLFTVVILHSLIQMFGVAVRALRTRDLNSAGESLSSVSSLSEEEMGEETYEKTAKLCSSEYVFLMHTNIDA